MAEGFKASLRRCVLILGVLQITVGCLVGLIPPSSVEWFRGIVMAHIEFTANGVLMVAFAFLIAELALGKKMLLIWFALLQIGTWTNGSAALIAGVIGFSSRYFPTATAKFPPPHGTDHPLVSVTLQVCAVTILICLFITLFGLIRKKRNVSILAK